MKIVRHLKVKNEQGLHMRPSSEIIKILKDRLCSVSFTYKNETINARSIMSILMLGVKKNAKVEVSMEGEDAQETMDLLEAAFQKGFGEVDGKK